MAAADNELVYLENANQLKDWMEAGCKPVEDWRKSGLLRRMYDGSMSKLEFQTVALATIVGPLLEALHRPGVRLVITERSPRSSREIFAVLNLSGEDMVAFDLAYNALWRVLPARREVTAYLEASVEAVMERVEARGRSEEQGLSRGFHESLRRLHEELKVTAVSTQQRKNVHQPWPLAT